MSPRGELTATASPVLAIDALGVNARRRLAPEKAPATGPHPRPSVSISTPRREKSGRSARRSRVIASRCPPRPGRRPRSRRTAHRRASRRLSTPSCSPGRRGIASLYPVFAGACVLYAALTFYGSLHRQTHGAWSAPLDDVFIHFDYARATARGYPFQWSEGNGFSSGNTSLTYPFVAGARLPASASAACSLMIWAAIVACVSTLGFLLAAGAPRRAARPLGEVPGPAGGPLARRARLVALQRHGERLPPRRVGPRARRRRSPSCRAAERGEPPSRARGWLAGLAGALLFATRPESVVCVAALRRARRARGAARALGRRASRRSPRCARIGVPGALAVVGAGAREPRLHRRVGGQRRHRQARAQQPLHDARREVGRVPLPPRVRRSSATPSTTSPTWHAGWGWLVPARGARPALRAAHARRSAILLWASALGWLALVALNRAGALAERALHDVRGRLGPRALRDGPRASSLSRATRRDRRRASAAPSRASPSRASRSRSLVGLYWVAPAPADARPDLVLRPRQPQHPRPAPRRGQAASPSSARSACSSATRARSCTRRTCPASISSASAATTICPSRAPACTASAPRSSSSSACPSRAARHDGHLPLVVGRPPDALRPAPRRGPRVRQRHLRRRREGHLPAPTGAPLDRSGKPRVDPRPASASSTSSTSPIS